MADVHPPVPPHSPHHPPKKDATVMISNMLAIAGFVILVIIIVWGLFHIATLSSGWFGSLFNGFGSNNTITVSVPASARSGEPVKLAWQYKNAGSGRYSFLYQCADGLEIGVPLVKQGETRAELARVPCGSAFTLGNATSSVIIVPVLASSTKTVAHLSMVFTPTGGGAEGHGSADMTVEPNTLPEPVVTQSKPVATEKPVAKPQPVSASGPADLAVHIVSATTDSSGLSVVTFDIANTGARASGSYAFYAYLPTSQPYTFYSDPQTSLAPGSHIVNTLRFSQSTSGTFTVVVDPSNTVREVNENNNAASTQITGTYNYNTYNGYNSYQAY